MEDIRIYIAEQRGETLIDGGRIRSTLNYEEYISPHRRPIGSLHHVNEWTGHAGQTFELPLSRYSISLFIPLVGGMVIQIEGKEYIAPLGTLLILPTDMETKVMVRQLGDDGDYFVFQQIVFSLTEGYSKDICNYTLPIVDPLNINRMLPVLGKEAMPFQLYMGAFVGKVEDKLSLDTARDHVFVMTLDGNFEVEERLLFMGDALFLPKLQELDVECLSNTGVLLVLHF